MAQRKNGTCECICLNKQQLRGLRPLRIRFANAVPAARADRVFTAQNLIFRIREITHSFHIRPQFRICRISINIFQTFIRIRSFFDACLENPRSQCCTFGALFVTLQKMIFSYTAKPCVRCGDISSKTRPGTPSARSRT